MSFLLAFLCASSSFVSARELQWRDTGRQGAPKEVWSWIEREAPYDAQHWDYFQEYRKEEILAEAKYDLAGEGILRRDSREGSGRPKKYWDWLHKERPEMYKSWNDLAEAKKKTLLDQARSAVDGAPDMLKLDARAAQSAAAGRQVAYSVGKGLSPALGAAGSRNGEGASERAGSPFDRAGSRGRSPAGASVLGGGVLARGESREDQTPKKSLKLSAPPAPAEPPAPKKKKRLTFKDLGLGDSLARFRSAVPPGAPVSAGAVESGTEKILSNTGLLPVEKPKAKGEAQTELGPMLVTVRPTDGNKMGFSARNPEGAEVALQMDGKIGVDAQGRPDFSVAPRMPELEKKAQGLLDSIFGSDKPKKGRDLDREEAAAASSASGSQSPAAAGPPLRGTASLPPSGASGTPERVEAAAPLKQAQQGPDLLSDVKAKPKIDFGRHMAGAGVSANVLGSKVTAEGGERVQGLGSGATPEARASVENGGFKFEARHRPADNENMAFESSYRADKDVFSVKYNPGNGQAGIGTEHNLGGGVSLGTQLSHGPNESSGMITIKAAGALFDSLF